MSREYNLEELCQLVFTTPRGKKLLQLLQDQYVYGFIPSKLDKDKDVFIALGKEELVKDFYDYVNNPLEDK